MKYWSKILAGHGVWPLAGLSVENNFNSTTRCSQTIVGGFWPAMLLLESHIRDGQSKSVASAVSRFIHEMRAGIGKGHDTTARTGQRKCAYSRV